MSMWLSAWRYITPYDWTLTLILSFLPCAETFLLGDTLRHTIGHWHWYCHFCPAQRLFCLEIHYAIELDIGTNIVISALRRDFFAWRYITPYNWTLALILSFLPCAETLLLGDTLRHTIGHWHWYCHFCPAQKPFTGLETTTTQNGRNCLTSTSLHPIPFQDWPELTALEWPVSMTELVCSDTHSAWSEHTNGWKQR